MSLLRRRDTLAGDALLARARDVAAAAHLGQVDQAGNAYIAHPTAVSLAVRGYGLDHEVVGLLHDVLEDSDWTAAALTAAGFPKAVVDALELLTHPAHEPYVAYVDRLVASGNRLAMRVKLADLRHNLARLHRLPLDAQDRLRGKYLPAERKLVEALYG
jgi:(p)ppGpp synthase/HD superfamily hydrolase